MQIQGGALSKAVSRRGLLKGAAAVIAASSARAMAQVNGVHQNGSIFAYVGSYNGGPIGPTGNNGAGLYLFSFNLFTGALTQIEVVMAGGAQIPSPSWIALHPNGKYLYTVNEETPGSVSAFSINRTTGALTLLNVMSSNGSGPAHCSVDPLGQFVFVANYGSGSVAVLPINSDGSLKSFSAFEQDTGSVGPTTATDAPPGSFAISGHDAPHAHMFQADPTGKYVFHADLGQDRLYSWILNRPAGTLSANAPPFVSVPPGDGPRHFIFHPNARWLYLLTEEASTVIFYDYNAATGTLSQQQMVSALPPGFVGTSFGSEIRISPDGRFLYAANRLHDTIAIFAINPGMGRLTYLGEVSTLGDYPRSFTIDPTGSFLVCCNQHSDALTTFQFDPGRGAFTFAGQYTPVGAPASIVFLT
jgi:6-phosphogluconolactonase